MEEYSHAQSLRVALFTDANVFAGTERHLVTLAQGLKSSGVQVSVACPPNSPVAKIAGKEGIVVIGIAKRGLVDWKAIALLRDLLRDGELDVLHAHNGRTALLAAAAKILARRGRCIATQHFLAPAHTQQKGVRGILSRWAHQWLSRAIDHVIAISEASRNAMTERGETRLEKISVVHHGIPLPDPEQLRPRNAVRVALGFPVTHPLVVCVARLEPEKDIGTLILAMKKVVTHSPQVSCAIAGNGSQKFELKREIKRHGLTQSVKLLGFQSDPLSLVNAADVFVLPSLAEPFGLAILEAMALGKPVIATKAGGPMEIVLDHENGLLVPPSDPSALADAILRLCTNRSQARQLGCKGAERFREKFTVKRMVAETLAIYSR